MFLSKRLAMLLGGAALGCGGGPQLTDPEEPIATQVAPADASERDSSSTEADEGQTKDVPVSEDKSFEEPVYAGSGMPSTEKDWGPAELTAAGQALAKLANKNRLFLPREDSPKSGPVFAKLISEDNLASLEGENEEARVQAASDLAQIVPQFLTLYAPQQGSDAAFPREQVRWIGLLVAMYPRVIAALKAGHDKGLVPKEQLEQQKQVAAAIYQGALGMLQEDAVYRRSDLELLRAALKTHRPALEEHLGASLPAPE